MAELGIRFKPDEQQAQMGPQRGRREGLQQAIRLISLRYPKVLGAASPVGDPTLLAGLGAPRISGFNPDAAILRALISAFAQGGSPASVVPSAASAPRVPSRATSAPYQPTPMAPPPRTMPAPSFMPGIDTRDPQVEAAKHENMQTYYGSPDYGGVPGWTPPPSAPAAPLSAGRSRGKWDKDNVF